MHKANKKNNVHCYCFKTTCSRSIRSNSDFSQLSVFGFAYNTIVSLPDALNVTLI